MTTYVDEVVKEKTFKGNVIIEISGEFFSIRQPDSGLVVSENNNGSIISLTVSPTKVDLKKANQTINSYSFRINDKNLTISKLFRDNSKLLMDEPVNIYLGRTGVGMDFADYFQLPTVRIRKVDHSDLSYNFSASDTIDRMNRDIFATASPLQADILNNTTSFQLEDVSEFSDVGFGKVGGEFFSWTGRDTILNQLTGITRGEFGTTPTEHEFGTGVFEGVEVEDNPINILLRILTSTGQGTNGPFDDLPEGLGIDQNLIDITDMISVRDTFFDLWSFNLKLFDIGNALKFFEIEILQATNLRFVVNANQKISVSILDQAEFDEASNNPIDENTITKFPKWTVSSKEVVSRIEIQYDFDTQSERYRQLKVFETGLSESDTVISERPLRLKFKGIRENLNGGVLVQEIGQRYIARFETPTPEITVRTQLDKSLYNVGDKVLLTSSQIPNASGSLSFADSLEIVSRAINYLSGDVTFKLQYTSYNGIRGAYIAPCTPIIGAQSQSVFEFPAGRAREYSVGYVIRLWDKTVTTTIGTPPFQQTFDVGEYVPGETRTIIEIDEDNDLITVDAPFTTLLDPAKHLIRFGEYDQVNEDQKKYAFVGEESGGDFDDGSSPYKITL